MRRAVVLAAALALGAAMLIFVPPAAAADITVTLSSPGSTLEGATGTQSPVPFTITLSAPAPAPVYITVAPMAGSARPGLDYKDRALSILFRPGMTMRAGSVIVYGDDRSEVTESFSITAAPLPAGYVGAATTGISITDDDGPTGVLVSDYEVTEDDPTFPEPRVAVQFSLTRPIDREVIVSYTTAPVTASSTHDFRPLSGTVTIRPGFPAAGKRVIIRNDDMGEPDEDFNVEITGIALGAPVDQPVPPVPISDPIGTVTIHDDDEPLPAPADGGLIVRGSPAVFDLGALVGFASANGISTLIVDGMFIGDTPADDAAYATLLGVAHAAGVKVVAMGTDPMWAAGDVTGAMTFVSSVITYNGAPGDDFDGVYLDVDPWSLMPPLDPLAIASGYMALITALDPAIGTMDFGIGLPSFVDGGTPPHPDLVTPASTVVDLINVWSRRDDTIVPGGIFDVAAAEAGLLAPTTTALAVGVDFRSQPDPETTFFEETIPEITTALMEIDMFFASPGFAGVIADDYAAVHLKMTGMPAPPSGPPPPPVPLAAKVDVGNLHSCALLSTGGVKCWGAGLSGRTGRGNVDTIGDDETPAASSTIDLGAGRTATAIAVGAEHTCAVLDNATVRCWGEGDSGRLGTGNVDDVGDNETPGSVATVDLGAGRTATAIAAGGAHTCAVLDDGTVRCWGLNTSGQLGLGNTMSVGDNETPGSVGTVALGAGRTAIGITAGAAHSCALLDNFTVRCWGANGDGQLGMGSTVAIGDNESVDTAPTVALGAGRTAVAVDTGPLSFYTCAVLDNATLRCWGANGSGQLGLGSTTAVGDNESVDSVSTVALGAGRTAVGVTTGSIHTCAKLDDGTLRCWGGNAVGQLGLGNTTVVGDNETPDTVPVVDVGAVMVTGAAAGFAHTCAALSTGAVRCWGMGADGRLGYGNVTTIGDDEAPSTAGPVAL